MKPNSVFFAVAALAVAAGLALVILAAEKHGKRRQMRKAWLIGGGEDQ